MQALVVDPAKVTPLTEQSRKGSKRQSNPLLAAVELRDIPDPIPPAPAWVRIRPALSGICAKDIAFLSGSDLSSPIGAYHPTTPFVLGHEVVGVVDAVSKTRTIREGDRVILEPSLFCFHKGLAQCRQCQNGNVHLCENRFRGGPICSGYSIGFSPELGGGWSEGLLAHESMLFVVNDIPFHRAVMTEPVASALHAVLKWSGEGEKAIVIGSGTMSRLIVILLRALYPNVEIGLVYERRSATRELGNKKHRTVPSQFSTPPDIDVDTIRSLGAHHIWRAETVEVINAIADWVGSCRLRSQASTLPLLDKGVDVVFDCRTTTATTDLSLRILSPGGTVVHVGRGLPGQSIDWSFAWHNELNVMSASSYGREADGARTFARARELVADPKFPLDTFVTHRYPLSQIEEAFMTAHSGTGSAAVKVVFEGPAAPFRERASMSQELDSTELEPPVLLAAAAKRARTRNSSSEE